MARNAHWEGEIPTVVFGSMMPGYEQGNRECGFNMPFP